MMDMTQFFISPVELRNFKPRHRRLETALESYEALWREYVDMQKRLERLESRVAEDSDVERRLRGTLLVAEEAAEKHKTQARTRSEETIKKARKKAHEIVSDAERERERLELDIRELQARENEIRTSCRELLTAMMERLRGDVEKLEESKPAPSGARPRPVPLPAERK
jgi:cell division septum initiation protein DivIVA